MARLALPGLLTIPAKHLEAADEMKKAAVPEVVNTRWNSFNLGTVKRRP